MSDLFADTSGWGHLIDQTQCYHPLAATTYRMARQQGRKVITANYIIAELATLLNRPLHVPRSLMIAFIEGLKASPYVEIVNVDSSLDEEAWQLLKSVRDKEWSLVDCASFVIMKHRGILEALTSDHHFDQAGFIRLLKS
ncbi:MAG: PIN domain-containing protein [bacterium]